MLKKVPIFIPIGLILPKATSLQVDRPTPRPGSLVLPQIPSSKHRQVRFQQGHLRSRHHSDKLQHQRSASQLSDSPLTQHKVPLLLASPQILDKLRQLSASPQTQDRQHQLLDNRPTLDKPLQLLVSLRTLDRPPQPSARHRFQANQPHPLARRQHWAKSHHLLVSLQRLEVRGVRLVSLLLAPVALANRPCQVQEVHSGKRAV